MCVCWQNSFDLWVAVLCCWQRISFSLLWFLVFFTNKAMPLQREGTDLQERCSIKKTKVEALVIFSLHFQRPFWEVPGRTQSPVPSWALAQVTMQGWELGWGYPSAVLPRRMEFPPQAAAQPQPRRPRQCRLPKHTPFPPEQLPPAQADCWVLGEAGHTEAVGAGDCWLWPLHGFPIMPEGQEALAPI